MYPDPAQQKRLLSLKETIAEKFSSENWLDLAALTGCLDVVRNHSRLLRSLSWGDEDYPGNVMDVLVSIVSRDPDNLKRIEEYVGGRYEPAAVSVSSIETGRRIYFTPSVFEAPAEDVDSNLVTVMMPFEAGLNPVYNAIQTAASNQCLSCQRVDDIWEHSTVVQDIFSSSSDRV